MTDHSDPSSDDNVVSEEVLKRWIAELGFHPELISPDVLEAWVDALNRQPDADLAARKRRILENLRREIGRD